jgi:hypothetical protein
LTVSFFAAGLESAGLESGVGVAGFAAASGVAAGAGAGSVAGASGALSWATAGAKKGMLLAIAMQPSQFRGKVGFQFKVGFQLLKSTPSFVKHKKIAYYKEQLNARKKG